MDARTFSISASEYAVFVLLAPLVRAVAAEAPIPAPFASGVYGIGQDRQLNLADQYLAQAGIERRIDVTVESFLLAPFLIQGTELVSHVLERAASRLTATTNIRLMESPFDFPDVHEPMYWYPRHTTNPGH